MRFMSEEIIAIIPARGGSKGIPKKNIKPLNGRPLISYMIEAAKESKYIKRVFVSTDDLEIAEISKRFGASVIERPIEISGDTASSESALLHGLEYLKEKERYEPEILVFLQCTSPLTITDDIDETIKALMRDDADSALAVTSFHYFVWKEENGNLIGVNHDKRIRPRRQDREKQYLETGSVYVMKVRDFLKHKHRFFGKTVYHIIPDERTLEIDEPFDFEVAEIRMKKRVTHAKQDLIPNEPSALILDFDGVFTDNKVLVSETGEEYVRCDRSDGHGIALLKKRGVPIIVLSTERNPVVGVRLKKLNIEHYSGLEDKHGKLIEWSKRNSIDLSKAIYVGNDVNDIDCMKAVGCSVATNDAYPEVKAIASITLDSKGGSGAVREICDLVREKVKLTEEY
jgi:YrbI family 3-deoxy-D-manno-octulosonate 8-phosphate phosphatase